jgi:hypothetical protein
MHQPTEPFAFAARFIGAVFGFVFFGVGLTVLIFLWSAGDGFGSPPLFFRIFGSFLAIAFVAMGGTLGIGSLLGKGPYSRASAMIRQIQETRQARDPSLPPGSGPIPPEAPAPSAYACQNCGAALGADAEVSPLGDVKCSFCGAWFNIHGRRT